jgi:light-harvesting protein B-800-850 beta chain
MEWVAGVQTQPNPANRRGCVAWKAQRMPRMGREFNMADDTKVYPTGLTEKEALEINEGLKWGTRIYGACAILAHILAYALTPWLK